MVGVSIEERAITLARYIIDSKDTVRGAAKKFGVMNQFRISYGLIIL